MQVYLHLEGQRHIYLIKLILPSINPNAMYIMIYMYCEELDCVSIWQQQLA